MKDVKEASKKNDTEVDEANNEARRDFLAKLGKYAVVAPPTIVALMANRGAHAQDDGAGSL